jgi:hypothetical protein
MAGMKEIFSEAGKKATGRPRLPDAKVKPNTLYQRARRAKAEGGKGDIQVAERSKESMSLFKRGKWYWMDDFVSGVRYKLPLKTTNWQDARRLEKGKLAEIPEGKLGSQGKVARQTFNTAADPAEKIVDY